MKQLILMMAFISFVLIYTTQANGESRICGMVKGTVLSADTQEPLEAVNVIVQGEKIGAAAAGNGTYIIENVPVGSYTIEFQHIGYEKTVKTDVIVRPERITYVNVELSEAPIRGETVTATAGYFQTNDKGPVSMIQFNAEEIRRSPGSAGDVSRILLSLPSTAAVADNRNDLMVRGGSAAENAFYVDGIQIPNINHFPSVGTTGGPIGMLNVDFIDDVTFSAGGFSAAHGNRMSSVIDISLREGNTERLETQLDMNMAGFGGVMEGPLAKGKGSWFISARHSFLDLIVGAIGTGVAPRYGDAQGKVTYDLDSRNRITLLNIFGSSRIAMNQEESEEDGNPNFGNYTSHQNTTGVRWRHIWKNKGFSNTALSYSFNNSADQWFNTASGNERMRLDYLEGTARFRNVNYYHMNDRSKIEFGLDGEYTFADYEYSLAPYTDRLGNQIRGFSDVRKITATSGGVFFTYIMNPFGGLTVTAGMREDYTPFREQFLFSPRFSTRYQLNSRFALTGAAGVYYQNLPLFLHSQDSSLEPLRDPRAIHYVAGMEYMLTEDTKMTLEFYQKNYNRLPLEPGDPTLSVIDDGIFSYRKYYNLTSTGKAETKGVELTVQKKLARNIYGMVNGAYFISRYRDYAGAWRNRMYDNRVIFNMIGGYKPNKSWEFSMKWTYAGGVPYTPFDEELSYGNNTGIIDQGRINGLRHPAYHSLNVRFDRRFHFRNSSVIVYASVWNAYNRKNVAMYYWNEVENKQDTLFQWSFLPLLGAEYEF